MLQALLKVKGGKQDGKLIPLDTKKFLIGREQDCHLRPGSESVSRHHCVINVDEFSVRIRDLGSSNGTWLNGSRIIGVQEAQPGDTLKVGTLEFEMVFSRSGVPVAAAEGGEKGGTTFNLTEFALEDAASMGDTTVMSGDTAVINKSDLAAAKELIEGESEAAATDDSDANPAAEEAAPQEMVAAEAPTPVPEAAPVAQQQPMAPNMMPQQPGFPPMQPQMPAYGGYPPQMPGYPPQMPGYPPQMPGYPGYGMPQPGYGIPGYGMPQPGYGGYPQQPMGYPQMAPQQLMPQQMMEPVVEDYEDEVAARTDEPAIKLPDPSETGLKVPEKKADDGTPKAAAPPNPAEEILKKYKTRR